MGGVEELEDCDEHVGRARGAKEIEGVLGAGELGVDDLRPRDPAELVGEVDSLIDRREGVPIAMNDEERWCFRVDLIDRGGAAELLRLFAPERFYESVVETKAPSAWREQRDITI